MPTTDSDSSDSPPPDRGATPGRYDFAFEPVSVYASVVALIDRHVPSHGVHLDLGCGHGAIAEPVAQRGQTYVGADLDSIGLSALQQRGLETHVVDLGGPPDTLRTHLAAILGDRTLTSLSLLDTLEHLTNGPAVLRVLCEMASDTGATLLVSVPNVTHRDIGRKLVTGRWDYTRTGILDETHVVHHTDHGLTTATADAGWVEVDRADYRLTRSDQFFPADHVALLSTSSLGALLGQVADAANPEASVYQFVRAYRPDPRPSRPHSTSSTTGAGAEPEPSGHGEPHCAVGLSVLIRTQGRRLRTLTDALTCLMGQENQDFEVLLLAHRVTAEVRQALDALVRDLPPDLAQRTRLIPVDDGGRSRPLNVGVGLARGSYLTVLDDDDLVLGNWTSVLLETARTFPGRVVRGVAVEQDIAEDPADPQRVHTLSRPRAAYPSGYDVLSHLVRNYTPLMTLAFPRSAFRDLGLRFDEDLPVVEDWDLQLRAVSWCGIAAVPEVIAVYRRWTTGSASHTQHDRDQWRAAERQVIQRLDAQPLVLPPGGVSAIRDLVRRAESPPPDASTEAGAAWELQQELTRARAQLDFVYQSASWRSTAPLRVAARTARAGLRRIRREPTT